MSNFDAAQLFPVKGLVVVITGAGSGLGAVMAHALDVNGAAKVFIRGRRESKLKEVAVKSAAVSTIQKQTPFINLVIANAAIIGEVTNMDTARPAEQTVGELQKELWNKTTYGDASQVASTNIAGSYFTFLAFLGLLEAGNTHPDSVGKSGLLQSQFISTTSVGGFCRAEAPNYINAASKAALNHLTKSLSTEFAKYSIRANAIAPGLFVTEMTEIRDRGKNVSSNCWANTYIGAGPRLRWRSQRDWLCAMGSYSRYASRDRRGMGTLQSKSIESSCFSKHIAGTVLYLASRAGSFVNGCVLLLEGGMLSVHPSSY